MQITRLKIVQRGLANRCVNCGGRTLFEPGTLFRVHRACPRCGLPIDRDDGFFLGSMSLNYGVTLGGFLLPVAILGFTGVIGANTALAVGIAGAIVFPALFYRSSRSWWLMTYYLLLPQHLPANRGATPRRGDENI